MKTNYALVVSAFALLSLGGCASQDQIDQQTEQLTAINASLAQIQANQVEAVTLQKQQMALQIQSNNLQLEAVSESVKKGRLP